MERDIAPGYEKYELSAHPSAPEYKLSFDLDFLNENTEYLIDTDPEDYEDNEMALTEDVLSFASCVIEQEDGELFFEEECFFVIDASKPNGPIGLMDDSELTIVAQSEKEFLSSLTLKTESKENLTETSAKVIPLKVQEFISDLKLGKYKNSNIQFEAFSEPLYLIIDDERAVTHCNQLIKEDKIPDNWLLLTAFTWSTGEFEEDIFLVVDISTDECPVKYYDCGDLEDFASNFDEFLSLLNSYEDN